MHRCCLGLSSIHTGLGPRNRTTDTAYPIQALGLRRRNTFRLIYLIDVEPMRVASRHPRRPQHQGPYRQREEGSIPTHIGKTCMSPDRLHLSSRVPRPSGNALALGASSAAKLTVGSWPPCLYTQAFQSPMLSYAIFPTQPDSHLSSGRTYMGFQTRMV